jgi:FdhD protein
MDEYISKIVIQFRNGKQSQTEDLIVTETDIQLSVQCQVVAVFSCSPANIEELAAGFLVSSGIVNPDNRILHLEYLPAKNQIEVNLDDNSVFKNKKLRLSKPSGCGSGLQLVAEPDEHKPNSSGFLIDPARISKLMHAFGQSSTLFKTTGGVHSAAISDCDNMLAFAEDIGRHNAVDKVIGSMYLQKQEFDEKILLTSGRISSEIVIKMIHTGIPMVISRSAPTHKTVELADKFGITVIGFARANNFNLYSHPERVKF